MFCIENLGKIGCFGVDDAKKAARSGGKNPGGTGKKMQENCHSLRVAAYHENNTHLLCENGE